MLVNSSPTTFNPAAQTNDLHIHTNHPRAARWAAAISVSNVSWLQSRGASRITLRMRVLHFHSEGTFTSVLAFLERNEMEEHLV
jgi:hypothetical protein